MLFLYLSAPTRTSTTQVSNKLSRPRLGRVTLRAHVKMPEETSVSTSSASVDEKPCSSSAAAMDSSVDVMEEANKLIGTGNRHLVMGDIVSAVAAFQDACGMLAARYGDTADECAEALFLCGKSLLELARTENTVLGNALEGVPEESEDEEQPSNSNIESANNLDENTRDELRKQVYDAMAEKPEEVEMKLELENGKHTAEVKEEYGWAKSSTDQVGNETGTLSTSEVTVVEEAQLNGVDEESPCFVNGTTESLTESPAKGNVETEGNVGQNGEKTEEDNRDSKPEEETMGQNGEKTEEDDGDFKPEEAVGQNGEKTEEDDGDSKHEEEAMGQNSEKTEDGDSKPVDEAMGQNGEKTEEDYGDSKPVDEALGQNGETTEEDDGNSKPEDEAEDEDDGDDEGVEINGEQEEDEVGNLQLAWEMLELAKFIYLRKESKEDQLMAAQAFLKLGEVSTETGNYPQALDDFQECLALQLKHLPAHSRLLAETHYQVATTLCFMVKFNLAIQHYSSSIKVIETRLAMLQEIINAAEGTENAAEDKTEMEELKQLLPDIKEKIEDAKESQRTISTASQAIQETLGGASTSSASFSENSGQSSAFATPAQIQLKSTDSASSSKVASDISHLVRKKVVQSSACHASS
ncbi:nuclear autoantigenic sperm protein isoform X2 [Nerophis ophidion]|uniref:nuclear autoantigenic sperm protein isoform X2 n=1 Tax=Nerophis ophidion TaxID=159077 RepID=UPI002AE003CF|nr:nuclear autoantigenic sperm protein isoform X2 [Nerophis ophidion]